MIPIEFFDNIKQENLYNLDCRVKGSLFLETALDGIPEDVRNKFYLSANAIFSSIVHKAIVSAIQNFAVIHQMELTLQNEESPLDASALLLIYNARNYNTICTICNEITTQN